MFKNTQYSILQYFNASILQYFNTSKLILNIYYSNKCRGLWSYPLVLPQITTNYGPLYQFLPFIPKEKEYLNATTLKLLFTYKLWKVTATRKRVTAVNGECLYTHTPSGWCSGVLANTRWKRVLNTSGCGISPRNPRY